MHRNRSWLYRASKAALNSVLKARVAGCARRRDLHRLPSGLGADRHGRRGRRHDAGSKAWPACAAMLAEPDAADNGSFHNYDGTPLPW